MIFWREEELSEKVAKNYISYKTILAYVATLLELIEQIGFKCNDTLVIKKSVSILKYFQINILKPNCFRCNIIYFRII